MMHDDRVGVPYGDTGSAQSAAKLLREACALYFAALPKLDAAEARLFDDVVLRLVQRADPKNRAKAAETLAASGTRLPKTIRALADDDDIAIAGWVLIGSDALSEDDLLARLATAGEPHRRAIAARQDLSVAVSDAVIRGGGVRALRTLTENTSARLSESGFAALVEASARDEPLQGLLAERPDLSPATIKALIRIAAPAIIRRLAERYDVRPIDYEAARRRVDLLLRVRPADEAVLRAVATSGAHAETVLIFARLADMPLATADQCLRETEDLIIAARALGFSKETLAALLRVGPLSGRGDVAGQDLTAALAAFDRLAPETAGRVIRLLPLTKEKTAAARGMDRLAA